MARSRAGIGGLSKNAFIWASSSTSVRNFLSSVDLQNGRRWDVGISGTKEKRPELDRLMADAHRRRFDAVLCLKFDRFARSVSHLLRALETFRTLGIDFVSFSELERSLIVERVRAGMRNARAKGKRIGRPPRTYLNQDTRRSIYEAYAKGGSSLRQLAVRFGTSIGTVQRCIRMYQMYQKAST